MSIIDFILKFLKGSRITAIFIVYVIYLFVCALTPFTLDKDPSDSLASLYDKFDTDSSFWSIPTWDIFSNILLFVPLGFLFMVLPAFSRSSLPSKLLLTAGASCVLSFAFELSQLFLPRAASLVDVFFNTIGAIIGALLAPCGYAPLSRIALRCSLGIRNSAWLSLFVTAYVVILLTTSGLSLPLQPNLSNWDPVYTFQFGNEATLDRPWLGKMFLVAIYNRALRPKEVHSNFSAGSYSDSGQTRIREGLLAFYNFTEGSGAFVRDRSTVGKPLDLLIRNTQHVKWLRPNGLEFVDSTIVSNSKPPTKLYLDNIFQKDELTIEAWISPANLHQSGPSRIVSYSQDQDLRNFTIAQDKKNIVFRLRTPLSGLNGTSPQLQTKSDPLTTELQHVVATYRDKWETLYVNGQELETTLLNKKKFAFEVLEEVIDRRYRWSYLFLIIFPVGFLFSLLYLRHIHHTGTVIFLATLSGLLVFGVVEGFQVVTLGREIDLFVLPLGIGVVFLSVLTSLILSKDLQGP